MSPEINAAQLLKTLVKSLYKRVEEKLGAKIHQLGEGPDGKFSWDELIKYTENIYNLLLLSFGPQIAKNVFENELNFLKKTYGLNEAYFQVLKSLSIPVMEGERLAILSRAELEDELKDKIKQLEDVKINLENTIKQRTQLISAERNKLAVILSGMTDAVIALDLNRNIITFNRSAQHLTGISSSYALGKPINQMITLFSKDRELFVAEYAPQRTDGFEGEILKMEDLRLLSSVKKEAFVNLTAGQIMEGRQINLGCILTLHNVTGEQELERMKLDFVAMAAHELRTPLTSLKGYLYVYARDYLKLLDEKQATIVQRLNISAQKLSTLVENLLSVSRIERGTMRVNLQVVDWVNILKSTVSEIEPQLKDKNLELTVDVPSNLPKVYVDPLRIVEVLSNLLTNAINYTASGGKIRVWAQHLGKEVITHVADSGQGIPKEDLVHLFTKFFRVSGPLEQGSKGTGLGLYIAKSIINMHHGRIWAESELNKGSTFSFALPIFKE